MHKMSRIKFLVTVKYIYGSMHVFVTALTSSAKCDLVLFKKVNYKMNKMVPKVLHVAVGQI